MTTGCKLSSGDAYAAWEEPKITRQGYANGVVATTQREGGHSFAELLNTFREAGREYDRDDTHRRRAAA